MPRLQGGGAGKETEESEMIPRICANCANGDNVTDAQGGITLTLCSALPVMLGQSPTHTCGTFEMDANPPVSVPDNSPESQGEPPYGGETGGADSTGAEGETTAERGAE